MQTKVHHSSMGVAFLLRDFNPAALSEPGWVHPCAQAPPDLGGAGRPPEAPYVPHLAPAFSLTEGSVTELDGWPVKCARSLHICLESSLKFSISSLSSLSRSLAVYTGRMQSFPALLSQINLSRFFMQFNFRCHLVHFGQSSLLLGELKG